MKLTTLLIFITLMQLSAATLGQKIILHSPAISIDGVFREIRKQTGYDVLLVGKTLDTERKIRVDFKDSGLGQVLNQVLSGTNLAYLIEDKNIVIRENPALLLKKTIQQTGKITGKVTDAKTGETLPGVSVKIAGTPTGALTDRQGRFSISYKPGAYSISFSYISYKTITRPEVLIKENEVTSLDVNLEPAENALGEVTISADRVITSSNRQLVGEMRAATGVVSGISSEQISISVDRSASEVVRRVAGITLQDGFISIRGMTPRYNPVFLNNAYMPSTDPNKRAFNFDLLPSNVIDRILVYKSGAPELPGDFAGGVVKVYTKKSVPIRRFEITMNGSYRTGNKFFGDHVSAGNGKLDWLGFDDGTRALPKDMPRNPYGMVALNTAAPPTNPPNAYTLNNEKVTQVLLQRSARQWDLQNVHHPMDIQGDATYYDYADFGGMKLNSVSLLRYELQRSYYRTHSARSANRYLETEFPAGGAPLTPTYNEFYRQLTDSVYGENVRLAAMQQFSLNIDKRNDISLMVLYNHMAKDVLEIQTVNEWNSSGVLFPRRVESAFNTQQLLTGVLSGEHKTANDRHAMEWNANYSQGRSYDPGQFSNVYVPEFSAVDGQFNGFGKLHFNETTKWQLYTFPTNSNVGAFSDGEGVENRWQGNADYVFQVLPSSWKDLQVKAGGYFEYRQKNYQFTALRYGNYPVMDFQVNPWNTIGQSIIDQNALSAPGDRMFTAIQTTGNPATETQGYKAVSRTSAGYAALNLPLRFTIKGRPLQWDIYGGMRLEYTDRQVLTPDGKDPLDAGPFGGSGQAERYTYYWLPSVNTTLHLSPKLQWRMAYYKTVNRPDFRELSPFITYNPADGFTYQGNSGLQDARIDNVDARLEWYPSEGETVTGGVYYKHIKNPIEDINVALFSVGGYQPGNLPYAKIYGAEIELRKKLNFISGSMFRHMGVIINAAYNHTQADNWVPKPPGISVTNYYPGGTSRPLQAASPWIINAGLFYDNKEIGSRVSLQYNAYGDRLLVNTGSRIDDAPAVFDRTRHMVDVSILQKVTKRLSVRVAAQNLLNAAIRQYADGDFNRKYDPTPHQVVYPYQNNDTAPLEDMKFIQGDYYLKDYRPGIYYTVGVQLSL